MILILTKLPRREHITPVLMKLHWLKIQDRIIYKMLTLTYKSYYNMAPPYLGELFNKKERISGHEILIVSGRVLKQCYLHNDVDADCKCIYNCSL